MCYKLSVSDLFENYLDVTYVLLVQHLYLAKC